MADGALMAARVAGLVTTYRELAAGGMAELPLANPALRVEAVGFRPHGPGWLGIVIAPWFFNAVLIPRDPAAWARLPEGERSVEPLPAGDHAFVTARVGGAGVVKVIPVVSSMEVFADQEAARAAAALALDRLFAAPTTPSRPRPGLSRRALFGRRSG